MQRTRFDQSTDLQLMATVSLVQVVQLFAVIQVKMHLTLSHMIKKNKPVLCLLKLMVPELVDLLMSNLLADNRFP